MNLSEIIKPVKPPIRVLYLYGDTSTAFSGTGYKTRPIENKGIDTIGSSLSSNQFTLPSGEYIAYTNTNTTRVDGSSDRLYNITNAGAADMGITQYMENGDGQGNDMTMNGYIFAISDTCVFELQTYVQSNVGSQAAYKATIDSEIYGVTTIVIIKKE